MSSLAVDEITDAAGTGRPKFSAGTQPEIFLSTGNGQGSPSQTTVRRYSVVASDTSGSSMTLTQDATNGDTITINEDGIYSITAADRTNASEGTFAISKNESTAGIDASSITHPNRLVFWNSSTAQTGAATVVVKLVNTDVLRVHGNGDNTGDEIIFVVNQIYKL